MAAHITTEYPAFKNGAVAEGNNSFVTGGQVYDAYKGVDMSKTYLNLWSIGTITDGKKLHPSAGSLMTDVNYCTSDFIPVDNIKYIAGTGGRYWFYDSTKTKLSTGTFSDFPTIPNRTNYYILTVPDSVEVDGNNIGVAYIRVSMTKTTEKALYAASLFEEYLYNLISNTNN